jgi:hypothetical protein
MTTTEMPTPIATLVASGGAAITAADLPEIREWLRSVGATMVQHDAGNTSYSNGRYDVPWKRERWTSPDGHDVTLRYEGPNPVGPERNGWAVFGQLPREKAQYLYRRRAFFEPSAEELAEAEASSTPEEWAAMADWEQSLVATARRVTK